MFVLGVRCDPAIVNHIPNVAEADYYMDHGVLVFPRFMRTSSLVSHGRKPTAAFWDEATKIIANRFHAVGLELPWISEDEETMVKAIQQTEPQAHVSWYYIPTPVVKPVS